MERGESVESYLGGYGLYYRTPLIDLGLVAPAGSPLGDAPTPLDVLIKDERAEELAGTFRSAVERTQYYRDHLLGIDPIPTEVLRELSERACLCRLPEFPSEQHLLRRALFEPSPAQPPQDIEQRRRSFALLTLPSRC